MKLWNGNKIKKFRFSETLERQQNQEIQISETLERQQNQEALAGRNRK
jgi:hypothetical protein